MGQKPARALRAELRLHRSDVPAPLPLTWAHPRRGRRKPAGVTMNTGSSGTAALTRRVPSAPPRQTCRRPVLSALRCLHLLETACERGAGGPVPFGVRAPGTAGRGPAWVSHVTVSTQRGAAASSGHRCHPETRWLAPGWVPVLGEVTIHGGGYMCGGVHLCLHPGL